MLVKDVEREESFNNLSLMIVAERLKIQTGLLWGEIGVGMLSTLP